MKSLYFLVVLALGGNDQPDVAAMSITPYESQAECQSAMNDFASDLEGARLVADADSMYYMETENGTDYQIGCVSQSQPSEKVESK